MYVPEKDLTRLSTSAKTSKLKNSISNNFIITVLKDLRFLQLFILGFKSSGMYRCVVGGVRTVVEKKNCSVINFTFKQSLSF
jgi:hypothetical protein